jgi:hypothetical protein
MMKRTLHRPEPVLGDAAQAVDRSTPPRRAAERLRDGKVLLVTDSYSTGAEILAQLQSLMPSPAGDASYQDRRQSQRAHREASLRLLAPISDHRVALRDARSNGFLRELYPELQHFILPFVAVQELHGAWGRYREGTHLAVLGHRVHPFYGTYVPTRLSHLELFGTWLSQYAGERSRAVDVGTGCGVLALMLAKAGFAHVRATDCNPNAVESLARELQRMEAAPPIEPISGDLLCEDRAPSDLIVFNPPWIQGEAEDLLERSLYFEDGLFERFFEQAMECLAPDGRIVLVFSTVLELVQPDVAHPILTELERGRLQLVKKLHRKVKPGRDAQGRRRRTREKVEVWELSRA